MKKKHLPTIIITILTTLTLIVLVVRVSLVTLKKPEFASANEKRIENSSAVSIDASEENQKDILMPLDWKIETLSGEEILISDQFQGKVLFVNIWATWCGPCVIEMPSIEKLYEQFQDRVGFICISDESRQRISRFAEVREIDMPLYRINGHLPKAFESPAIPTTFIISAKGVLAYKYTGAADWSDPSVVDFLNELIKDSTTEN